MPWLKLLHITAVILWCGALLYLPASIASAAGGTQAAAVYAAGQRHLLRAVFTLVATPAALVAIASGTSIFVFFGPLTLWLMAKLAVVGLLVLAHAACGMLILRAERGQAGGLRALCRMVGGTAMVAVLAVAALVLGKPS
jgi:putative membrane protein